jgi:glycosyltransferase involved in cell wall biosynthesis
MPSVSVLIRNRNEAGDLKRLLVRLREQHWDRLEIVVVDNDSTDDSRRLIAEYGCKLVHLPAGQFTYGRATNLGMDHCSGDLVMMLSAHSLPIGRYFIAEATTPFADPRVAAVRIPIASNTSELRNLQSAAPLDSQSCAEEVFRRGPVASGSVIRRSVWLEHRLDETLGGAEDKEWALRVLKTGGYIMPVVNAAYCYTRSFDQAGWIKKIRREETAGFEAANIRPKASFKNVVLSTLAAQRDVFRKARTEAELYMFRSRLNRAGSEVRTPAVTSIKGIV